MREDDDVFIMGEDIAEMGGSMGVTQGMVDEFGPERVRNTPISEMALAGAAIGAAMQGMRPVAEIMYEDFLTLATEQIRCDIATNMISPPNYFPVAWTRDLGSGNAGNYLKLAKVPTGDSGTARIEGGNAGPAKFSVLQSYPNPAGASITAQFELKAAQKIMLRLYSINGMLIETLASGKYAKGRHEIACRIGERIPSGFYALRLEAGGLAEVKNITLLR